MYQGEGGSFLPRHAESRRRRSIVRPARHTHLDPADRPAGGTECIPDLPPEADEEVRLRCRENGKQKRNDQEGEKEAREGPGRIREWVIRNIRHR